MKETIQNSTGKKFDYEILPGGKVKVLFPEYEGTRKPGAIYVRGGIIYSMDVF